MSSTQEKLHEPTILGKMVRDYRKSLGLNQTEFALLFGRTTPTAVSFWESGFREIPGSLCIALIDSAKREAAIEQVMRDEMTLGLELPITDEQQLIGWRNDTIAELKALKEGK